MRAGRMRAKWRREHAMFRKNEQHQQIGLFETVEQLPEKVRRRLEAGWGGTFYQELFCRIDVCGFLF
jgi:hypothetical protein